MSRRDLIWYSSSLQRRSMILIHDRSRCYNNHDNSLQFTASIENRARREKINVSYVILVIRFCSIKKRKDGLASTRHLFLVV